ncbi:MAG: PEP-CTERM sorting domain-containing protein [Verrucomicrobiales bacterium]|jgi:hypothetical protein|nr:PEP-CTERM sorting domain-containing protein [Verrucomicrobiales bacterium]
MKLKLLTLSILSVSALNLFADSRVVTSGTESDDGATFDYLEVIGAETNYAGTNITLNASQTYGANIQDYATVSLTNSFINVTKSYTYALSLYDHVHATVNNVNIMMTTITSGWMGRGVLAQEDSTLIMAGGTIHNEKGVGITLDGSSGTVNGVNIVGGAGIEVFSLSTLTLAGSDILAENNAFNIEESSATVNLDGNTVTGNIEVIGGYETVTTLTLTGSNGSVITGDVVCYNGSAVTEITLTGADTALHGNLSLNYYDYDGGTITLTLSAGALLDGGGSVSNLTLNDGAILGYTDGLTVTTSITLSGGITIDFSNITVQDGEDYLILDYTTASGSVNAENFTASGLDDSLQGSFSVVNNQLTFNATAVPEPTTWFLLGAGVGLLALLRRRK